MEADIAEAHTASEALATAAAGQFDLVLLDYQLPGGDGLSVLRDLLQAHPLLPVIVLTGFGDEQLAASMMKAGAADYLAKRSVSPESLERSFRHAFALQRAERERSLLLAREQRAREEAQAANHAKDEFLATLSHELRTPLNAILGWTRLLARDALDPADAVRAIAIIERNALLQVKLIDDLLDISRIISGKLTIERNFVDVATFVSAAVDSSRPAADARGVTLTVELHDTPTVAGDASRLQQVIINLLSNAIKFTPRDGTVTVTLTLDGDRVRVVVRDSGEGIEPAFLSRIFERFAQDDRHARRQGGLGLGLSIVRHLVEYHGGTVEAHSEGRGHGTTVTVSLPAASEPCAVASAPALELASLEGVRVLIVDDHEDGRDMTATVLEQCGARVRRAGSATDALVEALLDDFEVVVSDIAMPGEDGYALLARLRALKREPFQAVALTAFATADDRAKSIAAGFDAHLAKPVEPQALVQTLLRMVAQGAKARAER